ncbi:hypothetical protein GXW82_40630 [Streptacidiphilus sp. 4-A2]|nr:hypothetical protein [Streptacidiphilus sp. 4-A2]
MEIHKTAPGPLVPSNDETDATARTTPSPVAPTLSTPGAPRPIPRPGPPVRRPDAGPARIVPKPGPAPRNPAAPVAPESAPAASTAPEIEIQRIEVGPGAALERADELVDALLEAGRAPGQILVLTTGGPHPWQQHEESFGAEHYWAQLGEAQDVFYAGAAACRPVRREVVVLVVNGGSAAAVSRAVATARSHATGLLVLCGNAG